MPDSSSRDPAESTRPVVPPDHPLGPGDDETLAVESELVEILDAYLAELTAGQAPSRDELIARHPHLATRLEACLAGLEFIHRAGSTGPDAPTAAGRFSPVARSGSWRHGGGVRSGTDVVGPSRRGQGVAVWHACRIPRRSTAFGAKPKRWRTCITRTSCRSSSWAARRV